MQQKKKRQQLSEELQESHRCLLPLQTYSLDLLAELATQALPNLFQSK